LYDGVAWGAYAIMLVTVAAGLGEARGGGESESRQ